MLTTSLWLPPDRMPSYYRVVVFPEGDVTVYDAPDLVRPVATIARPVTAAQEELASGVVEVVLDDTRSGFARVSDFVFLPDHDTPQAHRAWEAVLPMQDYTGGSWNVARWRDGTATVRLELRDDVHSRAEVFEYTTTREALRSFRTMQFRSGFDYAFDILAFGTGMLAVLIGSYALSWFNSSSSRRRN